MTATARRRFIVTFHDQHALENVQRMLTSNFIGLGKAYSANDPNVVFLYPFPQISDADIKETLDELQSVGALTYDEDDR
jgi:hypothetical protein